MAPNGIFKGFYILSDLDGTFLDKHGQPVPRNIEAIKRFEAQGGLFSFASGRILNMMRRVNPCFDDVINAPAILSNGACLYFPDTGEYKTQKTLPDALCREAANLILTSFPGATINCYPDDGSLIHHALPDVHIPWIKFCITVEAEYVPAIRDMISERFPKDFNILCSGATYIEFIPYGITKGNTLSKIRDNCRKNGYEARICCVGDYENDIDMLSKADISFCPSNAMREVKNICAHTVCSNDEGAIADVIDVIESEYAGTAGK